MSHGPAIGICPNRRIVALDLSASSPSMTLSMPGGDRMIELTVDPETGTVKVRSIGFVMTAKHVDPLTIEAHPAPVARRIA